MTAPTATATTRARFPDTVAPVILALVMVAGLLLRLWHLDAEGFWLDEAISATYAASDLKTVLAVAGDLHPPLYYLLLYGWAKASGGDGWLRALSIVLSLATVPLLYQLTRRLADTRIALGAAALAAFAPPLVYFSLEARSYALCVLLATAATLAYVRLLDEPRRTTACWYALLAAAALYTHYYLALVLLAHQVYFFAARSRQLNLATWIATNLGVLALFAPWLPTFLRQAAGGSSIAYTDAPRITDLFVVIYSFCVGTAPFAPVGVVGLGRWGNLVAGGIVLALIPVGYARLRGQKGKGGLLLLLLLLPMAVVFVVAQKRPIFAPKYFVYSAPFMYVLLAAALSSLGSRLVRYLAIGLVVAVFVGGVRDYYTKPQLWREDARGAGAFLTQVAGPGSVILFPSLYQAESLKRYYRGGAGRAPIMGAKQLVMNGDQPLTVMPKDEVERKLLAGLAPYRGGRLYFVRVYLDFNDPRAYLPEILNKDFPLREIHRFRNFFLYEYQL